MGSRQSERASFAWSLTSASLAFGGGSMLAPRDSTNRTAGREGSQQDESKLAGTHTQFNLFTRQKTAHAGRRRIPQHISRQ